MVQNGAKMAHYTYNIDQGPISRLCPQLTPSLLQQLERICNAKGSKSKRAKKKERRRARKKFGTVSAKKIKNHPKILFSLTHQTLTIKLPISLSHLASSFASSGTVICLEKGLSDSLDCWQSIFLSKFQQGL